MKFLIGILPVLLSGLALAQKPGPITSPKGTELTEVPRLGLGTWHFKDSIGSKTAENIASAIVDGYRHIDLAWVYFNQQEIGPGIKEGIKRANITRKDLWITSKLWNTQ
jgi:alcohol dehydrogenase (NADP+)